MAYTQMERCWKLNCAESNVARIPMQHNHGASIEKHAATAPTQRNDVNH